MEGYIVSLIIFTAVFALFSLGLNLQWGFTGLLNFGQVAFMLVSAYWVVICTANGYLKSLPETMLREFDWLRDTPAIAPFLQFLTTILPAQLPMIAAASLGALIAALLGLVMGLATLKLRTDYLAIVTIGTSEILRSIALNEEWLTRGSFGIQRFPLPLAELNPSYGVRIVMILCLTVIVGLGYVSLWQWLRRTVQTIPWRVLGRQSAILLVYGAFIVGGLWGTGAIAHSFKVASALPTWVPIWLANSFPLLILTIIIGVGVWIAQRFLRRLSALSSSIALVAVFATTGWGLWVYGYAVSALYHYERNPTKTGLMWISVLMLASVFWGLERLVRSPWGRVLKAIREDEDIVRALGKNVFWYKLQSLMLGGAITGLSGALYAWQLTTIYPDNFKPIATFNGWTIIVLGGAGSNVGTLLGAVLFWTYQTLSRFVLDDILPFSDAQMGAIRVMLIGLLLMVLMMWRPQGILGNQDELTLNR
ncbi:MAG: branched-chain amino acid ABC transporter permease [Symploca sp. SIO2B6]|nr:branched-chain amino acid ABC transporter permease [Symploca sp. SIO2B6]